MGPLKEGRGAERKRCCAGGAIRWCGRCSTAPSTVSLNGSARVSTDIGENPNSDAICRRREDSASLDVASSYVKIRSSRIFLEQMSYPKFRKVSPDIVLATFKL